MAGLAPQFPVRISHGQDFNSELELLKQSIKLESENAIQQLERSKQYTTLVVTLGYAGIFAIWNFCVGVVPPKVHSLTGILAGSSLGLFVVFEILKTLAMQTVAIRQFRIINFTPNVRDLDGLVRFSEERRRRQEQVSEENFEMTKKLLAVWPFFFYPTIVLGFGALFLLMYNLFAHLTDLVGFFPS